MLEKFPFSELLNWYKIHGRHDLPWRDYSFDKKTLSYRVWLAETMLQQTQVERVKSYFHNILDAFPTIESLAKIDYEDFFPYYKGLGYYSRARNMLEAATQVVDEHNGIFPNTTDTLTTLKGVGPYTAEAIKAFAYNEPTLSFDTNLEKIFSRYYFGNKFRKLTKEEKAELLTQIQDFCSKSPSIPLIKGEEAQIARDINNALMDYGATVSLNSIANIDWELYPLASSEFYKTRGQLEPIKQKKVSRFPNKKAYIFAILHENHKVYFGKSPLVEGGGGANAKSGGATVPFLIGKNSSDPRAMIQNYFKHNHDLELSVRPPEIKSYNKDEIPYMICYCQIQSGKNKFQKIPGLKVRGFEEGYIEKIAF